MKVLRRAGDSFAKTGVSVSAVILQLTEVGGGSRWDPLGCVEDGGPAEKSRGPGAADGGTVSMPLTHLSFCNLWGLT